MLPVEGTDMATRTAQLASSILRWKVARQLTLGGIMLAAIVSTAAVSTLQVATRTYDAPAHRVTRVETYSGIGVKFTMLGQHAVITRVYANTPADGKVFPGAVILSVDGERPLTLPQWNRLIRGEAGTPVELELAYPNEGCGGGHQTVTLERAVVSIEL